ncbi:hypothetical protein CRUP_003951, partial [Coryphaenoides rupestris]
MWVNDKPRPCETGEMFPEPDVVRTTCRSVLKESGPPHMKSFLTRVSVGEFSAEGEGNSKKLSKKRAALSILQDLRKLPFMPAVEKPKTHYKKRPKTIIKVREAGPPAPETYATAATQK